MELVIGTRKWSTWSLRPWLALKRLGQPFTETVVDATGASVTRVDASTRRPNDSVRVPVSANGFRF